MLLPDIIAIGASAGGVEALIKIAASLPSNLRAAILAVIHVAPDSAGLMPSILNRSSLWMPFTRRTEHPSSTEISISLRRTIIW